jgi:nucleotide-binding universal stress UspA family protein
MPTLTTSTPSQQLWQFETPTIGGILVGFDGSPASLAALVTADSIAASRNWPVHVISVLHPMATYKFDISDDETQSHVAELRIQLRNGLLNDAIGSMKAETRWTHEVVIGGVADEILDAAERRVADLIIIGQTDCGMVDRVLGRETTLKLLRSSSIPILIVPSEMDAPDNVVVAVDFGPASEHAAAVAVGLVQGSGTVYLVHVEQPFEALPDGTVAPEPEEYPQDLAKRFSDLIRGLKVSAGVVIETVVLNGTPVPALLEFCDKVGADMLAAGTHGLKGLQRFLLGSVSKALVRNCRQPVLIVPSKGSAG